MRVSILGLGEAGRVFAEAYVSAKWDVTAFDPAPTPTPTAVVRRESVAQAVEDADLVLSLTTARFSAEAAYEAGPALKPDAVFVDLNAASPTTKREVATALGTPALGVDGAVLGSVIEFGPKVAILLAGERAQRAAELLAPIGARATAIGAVVGTASRRKLLRSSFVKSLAALISESMDVARASDDEAWLTEQMAAWVSGADSTIHRLDRTTRLHAERRSHELEDSLSLLAELGVPSSVTEGALDAHLRFARDSAASLADELAEIPTSALGDANDRQGILHSDIRPIWKSPRIAGRAFTIATRPGDNKAIHDAIADIRTGDVVVIDGGSHTERALIGELIAERLRDAGAAGVVLDAAVRDASEIEELELPTYARALTPAGPYRNGPGRAQNTVAVGGVVCAPGDYVVADNDGVIIVPALQAESILRGGQAKLKSEALQREAHRKAVGAVA